MGMSHDLGNKPGGRGGNIFLIVMIMRCRGKFYKCFDVDVILSVVSIAASEIANLTLTQK